MLFSKRSYRRLPVGNLSGEASTPFVATASPCFVRHACLAIPTMLEEATVSGGMLPKLEACTRALKDGVTRVPILPAMRAEAVPGVFTHPIPCGTEAIAA